VEVTTPTPWTPFAVTSPLRAFYRSVATVYRAQQVFDAGGMTISWQPVPDILDPVINEPGQISCRLDLLFTRPGKDQPPPMVAGRSPDRMGVLYCDVLSNSSGLPLILANDRFEMISGPIAGTFEIRTVPDVAQDFAGAHHIEVQAIEVSQALQQGGLMPFPGSSE
jgi:hypothetical protein